MTKLQRIKTFRKNKEDITFALLSRQRRWQIRHPEHGAKYQKSEKGREISRRSSKMYCQKHKEKLRIARRKYYLKNREQILEKKRMLYKKSNYKH